MSLFANKESYLGVDIGSGGIKLVELHKVKGRPQLWTYGIAEQSLDIHLPELKEKTADDLLGSQNYSTKKKDTNIPTLDDPRVIKYAELLKVLMKQAKVTTTSTVASLPVSYVFQAVVNLPMVEKKEIDHIVMAEIKKMLPRPIEEMQVVHQLIPGENADPKKEKFLRVLVTAAPRELVAFYSAIFQKAGLQLRDLETEPFALVRSLVCNDRAVSMIVDVGAERTSFFIVEQGLPLTHRSITVGGNTVDAVLQQVLGLEKSEVQQVKVDLSRVNDKISVGHFSAFLDPIVKEIEYSFDTFLHQTGNENKKPEKIILTGGSAVLPFLQQELQAKFSLRVFVGDPWARVVYQEELKKVLDAVGPRMSVALGLGMRMIF